MISTPSSFYHKDATAITTGGGVRTTFKVMIGEVGDR
jgi:hypothetical protein